MTHLIPVICDRCRAEGVAGEADFADFGDLLDFEPVPLQVIRVDGYSPEAQRAFIAALSILGSAHRAARAIGKSATGAQRLRTLPGSEGFCRAWERAKAISLEKGTLRLANSLSAIAAPAARPPPGAGPEPSEPSEEEREKANFEALARLLGRFALKVEAERRARLAGDIVAADLYLRQLTYIEVVIDLGGGGWPLLGRVQRGEIHPVHVAATPLSQLLDETRRAKWAELGEPERPPPPPPDRLKDRGEFLTAPCEHWRSGDPLTLPQWQRARAEQHTRAAAAQIAWEEKARADAAAWRARVEATEDEEGAGGEGDGRSPERGDSCSPKKGDSCSQLSPRGDAQ